MPLTLVSVQDNQASLCQHARFELDWTADRNYAPGSILELRCGKLRAFVKWRLIASYVEHGDVTYRWKSRPTVSDMWTNGRRCWLQANLRHGLRVGQTCRISLTMITSVLADLPNPLQLWVAPLPAADGQQAASGDAGDPPAFPDAPECCCDLPVVAGPLERLGVYCRPAPGPDGRVRALLVPQDFHGNVTRTESPIACELSWGDQLLQATLQDSCELWLPAPAAGTVGRLSVRLPMAALSPDENIANGRPVGDELTVTGNPVWPASDCQELLPAYGEIHWHTDFSGDGQRPIAKAFETARDQLNMQFAAPADHSPRGDAWRQTVEAVEAANAPDDFATFFGWEKSTKRGHENYYFTDPACDFTMDGCEALRGTAPEGTTPLLAERPEVLAVPHHSNAVAESRRVSDDVPFWFPYEWDARVSPQRRLIEIFQGRGNQERNNYSDAWRGWHCGNGASAQDALALGYRIGFTGGTDNHTAFPGRAWSEQEGGALHPTHSQLMTGVWTTRVERQAVFDALFARHTWAVWDCRAIVRFTVNGALGGSEITVAAGSPLSAGIRISADAPLQVIELVSAGQVIWRGSSHQLDCDLQVELPAAVSTTHVYLRARQRDGGLIYASPVFIDVE